MDAFEKKKREEEAELINLRYEVDSAKRQIASLHSMLSAKNREAAGLREQLIERDVLLKEAAGCIEKPLRSAGSSFLSWTGKAGCI